MVKSQITIVRFSMTLSKIAMVGGGGEAASVVGAELHVYTKADIHFLQNYTSLQKWSLTDSMT